MFSLGQQAKPRLVATPSMRCPECVGLRTELEQALREVAHLKRELAGRPAVTKNPGITVTGAGGISVTGRKRGRPPKGNAISGAERARRARAKRNARA
jgi:hypothetical protein